MPRPSTHEELISQLNAMMGNQPKAAPKTQQNQQIYRAAAKFAAAVAVKALLTIAALLALAILGMLFINTLADLGALPVHVSFFQAFCLIIPPVVFLSAVPASVNVKLRK